MKLFTFILMTSFSVASFGQGKSGHSSYGATAGQGSFGQRGAAGQQQGQGMNGQNQMNGQGQMQQQNGMMGGMGGMMGGGMGGGGAGATYKSPDSPMLKAAESKEYKEQITKGGEAMAKQLSESTKAVTADIAKTTMEAIKASEATILKTLEALSGVPDKISKESLTYTELANKRTDELLGLTSGVNQAAVATVQKTGTGLAEAFAKVGNGLTPHNSGGDAAGTTPKKNSERLYDVTSTTVATTSSTGAAGATTGAAPTASPGQAFRGAYRAPASLRGILPQ